ncbi:hypothetical protein HORM4_1110013 [Vibrio harveyi]|uniref:hypothetical protein n=1 Tax=Vibrio harveyi TaxID=669 RepID=UPI002AD5E4A7|nr:hypothetical protein [Vibrio harveyi]CAK6712241.1 hypothetical protein HORM4_1110013 [Vibrio harveyi]
MKFNNLLSSLIVTATYFFAANAWAFQVDTLMLASNEKGNGIFTVSNSEEETVYLKAEILKVVVDNNQIKKSRSIKITLCSGILLSILLEQYFIKER